MKITMLNTLALALLLPLTGCGASGPAGHETGAASQVAQSVKEASTKASPSEISEEIRKGMDKAKKELATKNIDVNNIRVGGHDRSDDKDARPRAEITPQGDLLIGGSKVAATPAQQTLLLGYRQQILGIAEAGMDIGAQGADLGVVATREALWGAFSGKSDKDIEAAIKPQTDKIEAAAMKLCERMPALLSAQQQLAEAMPEFRPYATMEQTDVDDCGKEMKDKDGKKGFAIFSD